MYKQTDELSYQLLILFSVNNSRDVIIESKRKFNKKFYFPSDFPLRLFSDRSKNLLVFGSGREPENSYYFTLSIKNYLVDLGLSG